MKIHQFETEIKKDIKIIAGKKIRERFNWKKLTNEIDSSGGKKLSKIFGTTPRSARKWKEGKRKPSFKYVMTLLNLAHGKNIDLNDCIKVDYDRKNRSSC